MRCHDAVRIGALVGLLCIELSTRRCNRMNGPATGRGERHFCVRVQRSFGNCPVYIQVRDRGCKPKTRRPAAPC